MKSFTYISLFTLHFLLYTICSAQNEALPFNIVPPPAGLHPASKVGIQDSQGYMWIGTYQAPLRRYDGYHYTFYSNDPLDSNSLAQNWIEALSAGHDGMIWVGTADNGVDRLDPITGKCKHFKYNAKDSNSLSNNNVKALLEDSEGMLWIGTAKGLNRLDLKTGLFRRFYNNPDDPNSLSCNQVEKIYEDRQGTIWVGTGTVWAEHEGQYDAGGLNRFDKKTNKFIRYLHDQAKPNSLINNKVKAIFEDSRGTFWVGTAGDGLHTMDRAKGTFQRYLYNPAHPEKLSRPPQKKIRPYVNDHITFIIEDAAGAIWIGTFGNGLNRYDPKTGKVTHYPLFKDPVSGLLLEVPWWACTSTDGILWIGYWRGSYRIDPLRKDIPYFATGTAINAMQEDKFGELWYGTDEGIVRKNPTTGNEHHFVHNPYNPNSISNNRVEDIYEDRQGALWICTAKGLNAFNRNTNSFVHNAFNKKIDSILNINGVSSIYEDKQGTYWFGIPEDLIHFNPQTNTVTHYRHDPEDSNSLSKGEVLLIYEDKAGSLWLTTFGGTLNRFSPQTGKVKRFLNGTNIHSLWQDAEGIMWAGTSIGLYSSNPALNSFSRYNGPNAEFAGNMIVNGVLEDDQKNLWITASAGICRINTKQNNVVIFSRYEDAAWYNGTGSYKGKNGKLYFGGSSGYFSFFPEQLSKNTKPPQIVINNFSLAENPVLPGENSVLKQPLLQTKEIHLRHDQNVFSFGFAGIHFSNPVKNQHLFMLKGLDKTWRKAGEEKTAYYYNVPPGHYFFRVKAANSDGVWAEKVIAIVIDPPWWRTWWAYLIYVLGFTAITLLFTWYRSRTLKAQNLLLEKKVIRRTKELEESLKEKFELSKKVENQQALLNERLRISRDLHDDIGSTLGSISIYSEVAKKRTEKNENTSEVLSKIGLASRELINKMSDIVWSLNPGNESFEQLQNRMMTFAAMMLTQQNISYDFIADEKLKSLRLSGENGKNIFLIFKEALHNIVKYAACKTVGVTLCVKNDHLLMTIKDDGKGFDADAIILKNHSLNSPSLGRLGGAGIKNMYARANDMNAALCISSKINEGTIVLLTLSL
ncbi:sensor histidine kinase [soil metagenome]